MRTLTIGNALEDAHRRDLAVQVLVEGQWLAGNVTGTDGNFAVLNSPDGDMVRVKVIRLERISALQIDEDITMPAIPLAAAGATR